MGLLDRLCLRTPGERAVCACIARDEWPLALAVLDQVEVAVKRIRESMAMPALPENPHLPSTVQVYPLCLQLTLEDNADSDIEWTLEDSMAFIKAPAAPITLSNNVYTSI